MITLTPTERGALLHPLSDRGSKHGISRRRQAVCIRIPFPALMNCPHHFGFAVPQSKQALLSFFTISLANRVSLSRTGSCDAMLARLARSAAASQGFERKSERGCGSGEKLRFASPCPSPFCRRNAWTLALARAPRSRHNSASSGQLQHQPEHRPAFFFCSVGSNFRGEPPAHLSQHCSRFSHACRARRTFLQVRADDRNILRSRVVWKNCSN